MTDPATGVTTVTQSPVNDNENASSQTMTESKPTLESTAPIVPNLQTAEGAPVVTTSVQSDSTPKDDHPVATSPPPAQNDPPPPKPAAYISEPAINESANKESVAVVNTPPTDHGASVTSSTEKQAAPADAPPAANPPPVASPASISTPPEAAIKDTSVALGPNPQALTHTVGPSPETATKDVHAAASTTPAELAAAGILPAEGAPKDAPVGSSPILAEVTAVTDPLTETKQVLEQVPTTTVKPPVEAVLPKKGSCVGLLNQPNDDELLDVFRVFDKDGDQLITTHEIKQVLSDLGKTVSHEQIVQMISHVDLDKNGSIDFAEFKTMMLDSSNSVDIEVKLLNAFRVFDRNCDGFVDEPELRAVLKQLEIEATDEEIREMIKVADFDKDGKVNFAEFKAILNTK